MQTILHNCCGLDVHKDSIVACIIRTSNNKEYSPENEVAEKLFRTFGTSPDSLRDLRSWLESNDCRHVVLESTGVFWFPVFEVLEDAFDGEMNIIVANARHVKAVPGRKTDQKDSEWLAICIRSGMLSSSFIPPQEFRDLRQYTRYRKQLVHDMGTQKNRIEKTLQAAGIKLSSFLTDIFGVSGRNLLRVIIEKGYLTPDDVEEETVRISAEKKANIKSAINGSISPTIRGLLNQLLKHLDEIIYHINEIEESIAELSNPHIEDICRLDSIPGISTTTAISIIAEIGTDVSKFPTAEHLVSWAGLSPGCNMSAGKKKVPVLHVETHT